MTNTVNATSIVRLSLLLGLLLSLAGCEKKVGKEIPGPLTFEITATDGGLGSEEAPLPFTNDEMTVSFDLKTIDRDGLLDTTFNGKVRTKVAPRGKLVSGQQMWFDVENGVASNMRVSLRNVHGTTTVWFENATDDEQQGNYATGLSPVITAVNPTIRNVQEVEIDKHLTSALKGDFVEIDLEGRVGIVTGVTNDGFYMTDITEPGYLYSSMYVYNHSRPDVEPGAVLGQLSGTVDEFYGFTELSFPTWKLVGETDLPEPVLLDPGLVGNDNAMEPLESALVQVEDVIVCPMGESFETFGQWAVTLDQNGSCSSGAAMVNVVSAFTYSGFNPEDYVGQTLDKVIGNLRFHVGADPSWIMYVRGPSDIEVSTQESAVSPDIHQGTSRAAKSFGGKK